MEILGIASEIIMLIILLVILTGLSLSALFLNKKDSRKYYISFKDIKDSCRYIINARNTHRFILCQHPGNNDDCRAKNCPILREISRKCLTKKKK